MTANSLLAVEDAQLHMCIATPVYIWYKHLSRLIDYLLPCLRDLFSPPDSSFIQILLIQGHASLCKLMQVYAILR